MNTMQATALKSIKAAARECLPPIVTRAIKAALGTSTSRDPLGIKAHASNSTALNNGVTIHHRGSRADRGVVEQIFLAKDYDLSRFRRYPEIVECYEQCANPLIVDCGANIGASAFWFATAYPRANVCAIEPEQSNFELLRQNCRDQRVLPVQGAVASRSGVLQLSDPGEGEWGFRTGAGEKGTLLYEVPAYTVADLVAMRPGTPFILKIDIEGAEQDLFKSSPSVIDSFPILIIELHDWMLPRSASSRPFLQWHAAHDRDFVFHGENVFSFSNQALPMSERVSIAHS